MITLEELGVSAAKQKQFESKGIRSGEDLVRYLPRKYEDYRTLTGIRPAPEVSVFTAYADALKFISTRDNEFLLMEVICRDGIPITIFWFNMNYLHSELAQLVKKEVLIVGVVQRDEEKGTLRMTCPKLCTDKINEHLRIYPTYSKIRGMSEEYLNEHLNRALGIPECIQETVPAELRDGYMSTPEMLRELHNPSDMEELKRAQDRMLFDDLLYFALRLELASRDLPATSKYGIVHKDYLNKLVMSLPYKLTEDQHKCIVEMMQYINTGKRLNALLQGDVGSGKTIVAFAMMCAIISCGCQAVIVAPTRQLAAQHYEDMIKLLLPLGINVAYYGDTSVPKKARDQIMAGLADGSIQIAVGTHALFSPNVKFKALGMVVIDEEHKFGVAQRKSLTDRIAEGVHYINMSATPIPRDLAMGIYGDSTQVFSIHTKPAGRLPTKTIGFTPATKSRIAAFIRHQYQSGHQTYVVCPAISRNESQKMSDVYTIDKAATWLRKFEAEGIRTEVLTGETKKTEAAEILDRFRKNETHILLATSVIEVGINVPSATGILILSAERFGLASLHQLRGRVGRGNAQGYCVLYGKDLLNNERIKALCETTDGFKIAEADLRIRGAGDFLGTQQSGDNKYVSLMLSNMEKFKTVFKPLAKKSLDENLIYPLLERAVADFRLEE